MSLTAASAFGPPVRASLVTRALFSGVTLALMSVLFAPAGAHAEDMPVKSR